MEPQRIATFFGIREGMKIADFGCGSGHFTILMAKIAGEGGLVTAIDIMDTALDTVRAKAKSEGLKNIATIRSNLEVANSSGLATGSQDIVLLANVLFQSNKKEEIIREASRILKSSGGMVIISWKKGAGGFGPPDELRVDPETVKKLAEKSGFKLVNEFDTGAFHSGSMYRKI